MDTGNILFYAVVCGLLSGIAPMLGNQTIRIGVGAGVGILAALTLPTLKSILGM